MVRGTRDALRTGFLSSLASLLVHPPNLVHSVTHSTNPNQAGLLSGRR